MTVSQPLPTGAGVVLARAIVAGIRHAVPEHAALFDAGATEFVAALLGGSRTGTGADAFRRAGAAAGADLDRLSRAYQAGGRCALPLLAELDRRTPRGVVAAGVDAVFRCVDVLIRLSTESFRAVSPPSATDLRRELLRALLAGRPWTELAERVDWTPPERVVAAVGAVPRPGAGLLADPTAEPPYALLPSDADPARFLGDGPAATGPAVAPAEAATSLRWARRTWELRGRGILPRDRLLRWPDHLTTHWLAADELLTGALAAHSLEPLSDLPGNRRGKLAETLAAVLDARGGAPEVAARLGIHPQTARNRLRRLRTLFGTRLDDPGERLTLRIALRAERVLAGPAA